MISETKPKILIVDDEPNNHRVYQRILEPLQLDISTAMSGQKALEVAHLHDFFLVLMDVQMPNMDGFETASLILDHPRTSHIPVIFITAYAKDDLFEFKGYKSGAVDYLTKPVNDDILKSKVKIFLDLHQQKKQLQNALKKLENEIEERKQAEKEKEKLATYLRQAHKMEAVGTMASGIAHNFNNILFAVIGNLELALDTMPEQQQERKDIATAFKAAQQAARLSTMMLQFVGQAQVEMKWLEVGKLFNEMTEILISQINPQIDLVCEAEEKVLLKVDTGAIRQVIINLVINAAEAIGEENGRISLQCGQRVFLEKELNLPYMQADLPSGKYVYLIVTDNGSGMDKDVQERAFEPFFTTKFTGRGMGLAAILGIMRIHNGGVIIKSRTGEGTSVTVLFPALTPPVSITRQPADDSQTRHKFAGTVLVLEDDQMMRDLNQTLLGRMGFDVLLAVNGSEALDLLAANSNTIVLILFDIDMHHNNSFDILNEIRKNNMVPIIMVTGYSQEKVADHFKTVVNSRLLQKPFSLKELKSKAQKLIHST